MTTPLLQLQHVSKQYKKQPAIDDITIRFSSGKIIGLLGPNGSGKTTLMKLINGLVHPNSGEIVIDGYRPSKDTKKIISYLPDTSYLRDNIRIEEAITFFDDFYEDFSRQKAKKLLADLQLDPKEYLKNLSKGNKEKVQLILVMSRKAKLYLLDEPIGGVDPSTRETILRTIINNYCEDASVIISTHLISEVEPVLDEVVFLDKGKVILQGSTDDLRAEHGKSIDALFRDTYRH